MAVLDALAGVIDSLTIPVGIEVERKSATGPDADGDPSQGPIQRFRICPCVVQPARGTDLLRLPEGDRSLETILVHSKRKLRTALESSRQAADVLFYTPDGQATAFRYVVVTAANWAIVGGFYSVLAQKEELD